MDEQTGQELLRTWIAMELDGQHDQMCFEASQAVMKMDAHRAVRLRAMLIAAVEALAATWGTLDQFSEAMLTADLESLGGPDA
jgi:hypothetical protein